MDDEYVLDTPTVHDFIAGVRERIAAAPSPQAACDAIRKGVPQVVVAPGARPGAANLALQKAEIGTRIHG